MSINNQNVSSVAHLFAPQPKVLLCVFLIDSFLSAFYMISILKGLFEKLAK